MATIKSLQDHRDGNNQIEQLALGVKLMSSFLTRFDNHARSRINRMNETLTHLERNVLVLQAKQSSTLDPPAAQLHSQDVTPRDSAGALADSVASLNDQPGQELAAETAQDQQNADVAQGDGVPVDLPPEQVAAE